MATSITGQGIAAYKAPDDALSSESKNAVQNKVIDEELSDVKNAIDEKQDAPQTAGTAGQVLGLDANLDPVWINNGGGSGGAVDDVQINGTSIVTDGVVNVPAASNSVMGAVQIDGQTATGLQILNGKLQTRPANETDIKGSWGVYKPITAYTQDKSVFYGLAKAAGDSTQSASANPAGTYTEEAKAAIQSMLGLSYKEIGTLTLDADADVWNPNFGVNYSNVIFAANFLETAQNTAEKDSQFELLDASGVIAVGLRGQAKFSCRVSGSVTEIYKCEYQPLMRMVDIQVSHSGTGAFGQTNYILSGIAGLHFFAPSGFYLAAGSTITMYAMT